MKHNRLTHESNHNVQAVAFIGSYVPRRCGIGTFSADLAEAIASHSPQTSVWSVALNDRPEGYRYPPRVWFEINQNRLGEYRLAADFLNMSNVDVCSLQHEFGLFGGNAGQHILEFIHRLRMPVVATLHTVLKQPDKYQLEITRQLGQHCDRLVVMAERAYGFLRDIYEIPEHKVELIHHGIPDVPFVDPAFFKDQFGVEGRKVILTFGLLSPNKGIENMIDALPAIVARHPEAIYIVLGATHPGIIAHSGEEYRLGLKRKAKELGVEKNVQFVNKFCELDELVEYLGAADVYVTPYHNEAQITSGTLAYALGTGKATVSTPYWYAQEMLADGRGKLVPFKDPGALSRAIIDLFDNEVDRHAIRKRAYQFTRQMRWQNIADQYLSLFAKVREERNRNPKPVVTSRPMRGVTTAAGGGRSELLEIKLDHLLQLTDDVGILHAAKSTVPDRGSGYSTQDNAQSLVAVLLAQDHMQYPASGGQLDRLVGRYLSFLDHAFDPEAGRFSNTMSYDRRWDDEPHAEDALGCAMWGLGEAVARCQLRGHMTLAANLFHRALPACEQLQHPRAWAFSLIGIHAYLRRFSGDSHARRVRELLAHRIFERFQRHAGDDWPWLDDRLTYANARFPHALLLSGRWMFNDAMIQMALRALDWLWSVQTSDSGQFAPVGTDGWFSRGGDKARFNQLPAEAAATIDACTEAFRVTSDRKWLERAERCLNWFLGDNDLNLPLYDHTTGGCADALLPNGISENQGATATLAWLLSLLSVYEQTLEESPIAPPGRTPGTTAAASS
jgi:glycosyltransferase involved in cell wall biosynthesis